MSRIGLASLRMGDWQRLHAIARAGGPQSGNDELHVWCPLCGCLMSGAIDTPNGRDDGCEDADCLCHMEDA